MRRTGTTRTLIFGGLASTALLLGACGSGGDTAGSGGSNPVESQASTVTITADPALAETLPQRVKDSGTIVVGTDFTYEPNEYLDNGEKKGLDVDLFESVAQQFGVEVQWQEAGFDDIIPGVQNGTYDIGISSFSVTPERKQQVTMVSYFNAGTLWVTQKGNPQNVQVDDACGKTVAVQTGTTQLDDLNTRSAACTAAGKAAIDIKVMEAQTDVTAAVVAGDADAMAADSPLSLWALQQYGDALESLGNTYDLAPYGYVLPKSEDTEFAEAMVTALENTRENGEYDRVLGNWSQSTGALATFRVNP